MARRGGAGANGTRWGGAIVAEARRVVGASLPAPCGKCGGVVDEGTPWNVGHRVDRWERPDLMAEPSNWQAEHRRCSDSSGQAAVIAKAKAEARAEMLAELESSGEGAPPEPPPLPEYLPGSPGRAPGPAGSDLGIPGFEPYDSETLRGFDWLEGFVEAPADASHPLAMSAPHPRAVGSYGARAIEWIEANVTEKERPIRLRWWQKLAVTRSLEHDEAGALVWRTVVETCPRRAGKSVRLRAVALWRIAHSDLIGERQLVVHTGRDMNIVEEVLGPAQDWAEARDWKVKRANGKREIIGPDGDRWVSRSVHGLYGYDVCLGMVDEAWDVEPRAVDDGLEPATMERLSPQILLTSTAHRRATGLMKGRISDALAAIVGEEETSTLLLLWAAPPGADWSSEETWRLASPHWSDDRRDMIREKYRKALRGEEDPEADDPDPLEGWISQYMNVWRLRAKRAAPGRPVVTEATWSALAAPAPSRAPDAVAVESWFSGELSVARAWAEGGRVVVSVSDHATRQSAAAAASAAGCPAPVMVGKSLAEDPAFAALYVEPMQQMTIAAVRELAELVAEGGLAHDGSPALSEQALALRVSPGANGPRLRSTGRADAVKALAWAATEARQPRGAAAIW